MKRKYWLLIFILFIVTSVIGVYAIEYIGDVDNNGKAGSSDYILIRKHIIGTRTLTDSEVKRADINGDNKISSADYIALKKIIVNGDKLKELIIKYIVTYNPNGGSGSNVTQTVDYNKDWKTKGEIFTRTGFSLIGWSPSATGSVSYTLNKDQGKYTSTSNLTLYAVWQIKQFTITYNPNGGSGSATKQTVDYNTNWTTKDNIFKRDGYTQIGWSTSSTGGVTHNSNKEQGRYTSTSDLTLYAVWQKESTLVLPEDFNVTSKYSLYQEYYSPTLKYKTLKAKDGYRYYGLVWVKDAYHQLNSANSNMTSQERMTHLNNEIGSMNYGNKGMIATNGSFTVAGRSNSPVIASKGIYTVNDLYRERLEDGRAANYTILTLGSDGILKTYDTTSVSAQTDWLNSVGGRNTWTIVFYRTGDWNYDSWQGSDFRTGICQIDKYNFVLYVGYSSGISGYMKELHDEFGCVRVANLDGGGSPGMYYKYNTDSRIKKVYEVNKDYRTIADMLYFVEQ